MARWTIFGLWARWIGWTALFTVVLSVCSASLFPQSPLRMPDSWVAFWGGILGLAALAFGIGVRFPHWAWVVGVFVASVLQFFIVAIVLPWPPESGQAGLGLIFTTLVGFLFMVPAGAGVWWGKRRRVGTSPSSAVGPRGDASSV